MTKLNWASTLCLAALASAAAPALTATRSFAQDAPKIFFEGDMVRGGGGKPQGTPCVLNSQFQRGEAVIFRMRLRDPKTGQPLDKTAVKSLKVKLMDGELVTLSYHQHPPAPKPAQDYYWSGGWIVPAAQPTGSLTYEVEATTLDGQTVTWSPFKMAPSELTIVEK